MRLTAVSVLALQDIKLTLADWAYREPLRMVPTAMHGFCDDRSTLATIKYQERSSHVSSKTLKSPCCGVSKKIGEELLITSVTGFPGDVSEH